MGSQLRSTGLEKPSFASAASKPGSAAARSRAKAGPPPTMRDSKRVAVLISGRGSNMQALVEQAKGYEMVLVVSNKPHAPGLDWARARGLPSWAWDSKGVDKEEFDRAMSTALDEHDVGTIALAGF